ncbi:unnamed protein product [Ixodes persulcatus]
MRGLGFQRCSGCIVNLFVTVAAKVSQQSSQMVPCILRDLTSLLPNLTSDSVWNGTDPVLKS